MFHKCIIHWAIPPWNGPQLLWLFSCISFCKSQPVLQGSLLLLISLMLGFSRFHLGPHFSMDDLIHSLPPISVAIYMLVALKLLFLLRSILNSRLLYPAPNWSISSTHPCALNCFSITRVFFILISDSTYFRQIRKYKQELSNMGERRLKDTTRSNQPNLECETFWRANDWDSSTNSRVGRTVTDEKNLRDTATWNIWLLSLLTQTSNTKKFLRQLGTFKYGMGIR